ncbi:MAG: integrin alpha, partial [Myxococcota bacterium]|nr:integrin alpha [Myxococcota bacterium]
GPGDINGDGTPDLLLGTPAADRAGPASGAAFVFLGPISGTRSAASAEAVLTGIGSGARVGAAVAFIPDLGGDGADELLVGGPTVSPAGRAGAGAAYLIAGGGP